MRRITALLTCLYRTFDVIALRSPPPVAGYTPASPRHKGKCNIFATRWLLQSTKKHQFCSNLQPKLLLSTTFHASTFCLKERGGERTEKVNMATVCSMRLARHSYKNRFRPTSTWSDTTKVRYMQPNRKFQ